jgi:acyl carrier protein
MTTGEAEFDAEGVGQHAPADKAADTWVRRREAHTHWRFDTQLCCRTSQNGHMGPERVPDLDQRSFLMTPPREKGATAAAVVRVIIDFIRAEVGAIDLTADSSLHSAGLDSVKVMSLVFRIESHYEIALDIEDADDLETVRDLANLVVRRLRERA